MPLTLASGSPQRRAILEQLGIAFTVAVSGAEELEAGPAEEVAVENARRKALAVAGSAPAARPHQSGNGADGPVPSGQRAQPAGPATGFVPAAHPHQSSGAVVLGVDTVVALDGRIYGKPVDRREAAATLRALAGRTHRVVSGICVIEDGSERTASAETRVSFRPMSDSVVDWYLETDEWRGRAGGYAIQGHGAALVRSIEGDYLNVVGLPVATLLDLLPLLLFSAI